MRLFKFSRRQVNYDYQGFIPYFSLADPSEKKTHLKHATWKK